MAYRLRGVSATIDNQDMAYAGQRFDLIEVSGLDLAGKYGGTFLMLAYNIPGNSTSGCRKSGFAGDNLTSVNALL